MPEGLERLRSAWEHATMPARAAFLREVQGRAERPEDPQGFTG